MTPINPLQSPINYAVDVESPFEAALGGFKVGLAGAESQARTKESLAREAESLSKIQEARDNASRYQAAGGVAGDPRSTLPQVVNATIGLDPAQAKVITDGFNSLSEDKQRTQLNFLSGVYSAYASGSPEIGKGQLQAQEVAYNNAGMKREAQAINDALKLIDINPAKAMEITGLIISAIPGGKEILENIDKTLSTGRIEAQAPEALKKAVADADKAVADAITAQATAANAAAKEAANAARATAEAEKAKVDAKFAEQAAAVDLQNKAANLQLTKAQTDTALQNFKKIGVEIQKSVLELSAFKANGGRDVNKIFEQEEKLRKEYQVRTQVAQELGSTFKAIQSSAASKNGPGDIALITLFMKMLDPSSVVRETEFSKARDTAGVYQVMKNTLQKLESGQLFSLDSKQRQEYVALSEKYLSSALQKAAQDKNAINLIVKNYGLNSENVFGTAKAATPETPKTTGNTGSSVTQNKTNVTQSYNPNPRPSSL